MVSCTTLIQQDPRDPDQGQGATEDVTIKAIDAGKVEDTRAEVVVTDIAVIAVDLEACLDPTRARAPDPDPGQDADALARIEDLHRIQEVQ